MPRPLTAVAVANAKPDASRRIEITDGATPGLRLVIQPSGSKSWVFRYEHGGRAVKLTLGPAAGAGALTLAEAREEAGKARKCLVAGRDPVAERKAARAAEAARIEAERKAAEAAARRDEDLIENVVDRYVARHVERLKSAHEVKRLFEKEVKAPWRGRLVAEIGRKDVLKLIDDIAERGAGTTANRTLANLRAFFNWCVDRGLLEASPCERIRPPKAEMSRERVLTDAELRLLVLALRRLEWPWREFFTLALLTGQRREEIAGMRWDELDVEARDPVWVLPSKRTKNGREHAIPLVNEAVEALRQMRRIEGSEYVLTTTGTSSVSGFSRAKASLDAMMLRIARDEAQARGDDPDRVSLAPWRLHDLRRTAASGMARGGVPVAVVEKVLNHVSGTFAGIVGVYQRHDFASEKRHALTAWAAHIGGLVAAAPARVDRVGV
ncbi:tyrosine-type recombinase/integrase [Methylobacterium isbiliense]|jgi:integrase|uniref:Prophage integrase IntA n=1 Tax=Methylobacterium isbiliense TaxID=315478 RepID=A0ABQ4S7K7_9HYPH|nr:site-specific integrase [Methylobacterium isbiliense]MDN3624866.1 tyrosine-type recombinase/integrase [Methylobacterium isbiliense]GJD98102.1 Prophage integrase IntA [Methylobacterium isbiliense]